MSPITLKTAQLQLTHWQHIENRKVYQVTGECLVKDPTTGIWEEHVLYTPVVGPQYPFARTYDNFIARFHEVDK